MTDPINENTAIQTAPVSSALNKAEQLPEWLRKDYGSKAGFEQASKEDFTLPRLAICQALTPQRKKSNPGYIEGLVEGDFFNTLSGRIYGKRITVIPLFFARNRIKFLEPIGSGIECMSLNGRDGGSLSPTCRSCQFSVFNGGCTEFKNIVLLVNDDEESMHISSPLLFSNKSTMISVLKQWNSMMNMTNLPMYSGIYSLTTMTMVKNNNEFFTWNFTRTGWVPEEIYTKAKSFFESLHDQDISFDFETMIGEQSATRTNSEM